MNQQFVDNNYLYVPGFISTQEADDFAQWMYLQEQLGLLVKDSRENLNLFGMASLNGLPFIKLLVKKIPEISDICGEDVLPTYTYAIIYKHNSELIRHTDRPACEISVTINLQKDVDWPVCVKTLNGEEVCIELNPGDALVYKGCEIEHWRSGKFNGQNFIQVFLHYVNANGNSADLFFDRKKTQ
jgi:hypothetical protein